MGFKRTIRNYKIFFSAVLGLLLFSCNTPSPSTKSVNIAENWEFKATNEQTWYPATVPGCVHTDLLNNKLIEDPFFGANELKLQWIDKKDWEYKTTFKLSEEQLKATNQELLFEGLDTWADVYLNEEKILSADNMFIEWRVDCTGKLKIGENSLNVKFKSPIRTCQSLRDKQDIPLWSTMDDSKTGKLLEEEKLVMYGRKAQYHFAWDWGPRFVTSGICLPVSLITWNEARISNVHYITQKIDDDKAKMLAKVEIETNSNSNITISIADKNTTYTTSDHQLSTGVHTIEIPFEIENPKLWWSNGLGEAHLYPLTAKLKTARYTDTQTHNVGIRTVKLVSEKDSIGRNYYFELNGEPVFIKGANYIPQDNFAPRVTNAQYTKLLNDAKESNMNCIRVWGGGIYEKDIFYDLCDKNGLLVFHDFMFGCAHYPGHDEKFMNDVRKEAIYQIKRLRNHPCMANWCGNNEMQWVDPNWYKKFYKPKDTAFVAAAQNAIYFKLLPDLVKEYDPGRPYIPSSPYTPDGRINSETHGDMHDWSVYHRWKPVEYYKSHIGRFMSEYGMQSFPEMKTIETFATPLDYAPQSEVMNLHQKTNRKDGNEVIQFYNDLRHKEPKDFSAFVYLTQQTQAYGIRTAIEAFRRAKPYCWGSIYWQFNDAWPGMSWSSYDYFGRWKALHYKVKKAYAPILVSPDLMNDTLTVHLVSDYMESKDLELELELLDFNGKVLWEKKESIQIPKNGSVLCFKAFFADMLEKTGKQVDKNSTVLYTCVKEDGVVISERPMFFNIEKELKLENPSISYLFENRDGKTILVLNTKTVAPDVAISFKSIDAKLSDNYVDLIPGKVTEIIIDSDASLSTLEEQIEIMTLHKAYK